ncbi:MAG TPA: glycine cleavage T C-terminal barrel domain-containing protein [Terriglobia bacterium]|jgi:folate-binding protein YgfZ
MIAESYKASTQAAALVEKDWAGLIKLSGGDRVTWLQGMVTNDVARLKPGTGCYAAHLTPQGKIVAHMQILAGDDALWLSLERSAVPALIAAFDKLLIMEDVQMTDASDDYSVLGLLGPQAPAVLAAWLGEPPNLEKPYSHRTLDNCRVVLSDLGYDIWVPRAQADSIVRAIAQAGAMAIDHGTWDVVRTEAGIPIYGVDIDSTTTMPEIGEAGISYDKGCYIGQEVVAKVKYIGHVNRRFVGLILAGSELPEIKSVVRKGGREVGHVTTSLFSPKLNKPIALAFVNLGAYAPGNQVEVGTQAATIVDLPFKDELAG